MPPPAEPRAALSAVDADRLLSGLKWELQRAGQGDMAPTRSDLRNVLRPFVSSTRRLGKHPDVVLDCLEDYLRRLSVEEGFDVPDDTRSDLLIAFAEAYFSQY